MVIGGDTITTREESERVFAETFSQLAQEEDLQVVAVVYPKRKRVLKDPKLLAQVDKYVAAIRDAAEERHFLLVDAADAFDRDFERQRIMQSDGPHGTIEYHSAMGDYTAAAYLDHVQRMEADARD